MLVESSYNRGRADERANSDVLVEALELEMDRQVGDNSNPLLLPLIEGFRKAIAAWRETSPPASTLL